MRTSCMDGHCDRFFDEVLRPFYESLGPGSARWKSSMWRTDILYDIPCAHPEASVERAKLAVDLSSARCTFNLMRRCYNIGEVKEFVHGFNGCMIDLIPSEEERTFRMSRLLCILYLSGAGMGGVFSWGYREDDTNFVRATHAIAWCKRWYRCTLVCEVECFLPVVGIPELVSEYAPTPFDCAFESQD